jgi:hypothetical protein
MIRNIRLLHADRDDRFVYLWKATSKPVVRAAKDSPNADLAYALYDPWLAVGLIEL